MKTKLLAAVLLFSILSFPVVATTTDLTMEQIQERIVKLTKFKKNAKEQLKTANEEIDALQSENEALKAQAEAQYEVIGYLCYKTGNYVPANTFEDGCVQPAIDWLTPRTELYPDYGIALEKALKSQQ